MRFIKTPLPGVVLLEPQVHGDARGFFVESYRQSQLADAGLPAVFVQENHSRSAKGVLRGLHYQLEQPQGKLVRVTRGEVYDVAVDVRRGSPHFGQWFGVTLDDRSLRQLYIPEGFAHGFVVLSDEADFVYKCTDYYHPESEQGIAWDDPAIGIEWPLSDVVLSAKDQMNSKLRELADEALPKY